MDLTTWIAVVSLVLTIYGLSDTAIVRIRRTASVAWRWAVRVFPVIAIVNSIAGLWLFYEAAEPITRGQVLGVALHTCVLVGTPLVWVLGRIVDRVFPDKVGQPSANVSTAP